MPKSREQQDLENARRRERYASDPEYREEVKARAVAYAKRRALDARLRAEERTKARTAARRAELRRLRAEWMTIWLAAQGHTL